MNHTNVEQSKKLLELGISKDSADMIYLYLGDCYLEIPFEESRFKDSSEPVWSVSKLLDMMPASIGVMNDLTITKDCANGIYNVSYEPINDCPIMLFVGESLIDAIVDMIEWLYRNNYMGN